MKRCDWVGSDPIYVAYHDTEWGVPEYDGRVLWEKLILEGFQAGLSWITILKKRENFREAFAGFDPDDIANWGEAEVEHLLQNPGIVRHRGKIEATINSARAWQDIERSTGFAPFIWRYVDYKPIQNRWMSVTDLPASTFLSKRLSHDLRKAGFRFCGPTIVYSFMQACGLVNDHLVTCPRYSIVSALGAKVYDFSPSS